MAIKTPEAVLAAADYLATDEQVAALARSYHSSIDVAGTVRVSFLRVVVAYAQKSAKGKRVSGKQAQEAVNTTYDRLYAVVLDAVTTPDVTSLERNRRSNFARTAKYAIDSYLAGGGKLMSLDAKTVTKEALRRDSVGGGTPEGALARSAVRAGNRLVKLAAQLVEEDREEAERFVNELITQLGLAIAKPLTTTKMKRGEITLHPAH